MDDRRSDLAVGATASITRVVESADVEAFARLTGDTNPVHLDDEYASQTRFGRRIAHGILISGYISAVLGTILPGPGAIYLSQALSFKAPVYIGDTITASVTITNIKDGKPIITLATRCTNGEGQVVIEGEAILLYPPLSNG